MTGRQRQLPFRRTQPGASGIASRGCVTGAPPPNSSDAGVMVAFAPVPGRIPNVSFLVRRCPDGAPMPVNLIVGNDGSNTLQGTAGADLIYGYDPNGPQSQASAILATRVAAGLSQPLFAGAPPGDTSRLFIVEKTGQIKILDLATGQVLATPFLDVSGQISTDGERGLLGLAFDPDFASNGFFYVDLINTSGDAEIRRYHVSANPNVADPASATPIITIDQTDRQQPQGRLARLRSRRLSLHRDRRRRQHADTPRRTSTACSARSCASTCMATPFPAIPRATMRSPPTIPSWARRAPTKSLRSACAIRGGRASTAGSATSTSPMSARANGKRSTSARTARTTAGTRSRARQSFRAGPAHRRTGGRADLLL